MDNFKYIFRKILCGCWGLCVLTLTTIIGFSAMQLYLPVLLQRYIDLMVEEPETGKLMHLAGIYLFISIGIYLAGIAKDWGAAKAAWVGTDFLRMEIIGKILHYDQEFFQKNAPGQIIESLENDLNEIEYFIENTLIPLLVNLMYMIGVLFVFWNTSKWAAALFGAFIAAALCIIYVQQKKDSDIILKERRSHAELIEFEGEIIAGKKEIELAAKEDQILRRLEQKIQQRIPLKVELQNYYYRVWIITLSLLAGANILSLLAGGILYLQEMVTLGLVYLMYSYGNMLKQPFEELQLHIQNFLAAKGSCEKLAELLFYENTVSDGEKTSVGQLSRIELRNISFCYGKEPILKGITIKIEKGEKIGIFGESGAGKSTVGKLISKGLEPQEGEILINGTDIREYSVEAVTGAFAYVTAGNLIFNTDLRNNLRLYNEEISDEEILEVLEGQGIAEYLPFTGGRHGSELLDMEVNRQMLSNGEAQLLNLCRLFFPVRRAAKRPDGPLGGEKELIIFDEASAMIDEEIENAFYQIFRELTEHVTTLIITHNVERLKDCDVVYMLERGEVIEAGRVCELKNRPGSLFRKYVERSWGGCERE